MKGFCRNSPQKVHPNFAQNLGRQILRNTFSGLDVGRKPQETAEFCKKPQLVQEPVSPTWLLLLGALLVAKLLAMFSKVLRMDLVLGMGVFCPVF